MAVLFASTKSKSRCCMHFFSASTAVLYASTKSESRCYMHFFSASMAMLILHLRSLKADVAWSGGARFCLWSYRQPTVPVKVGCWVECREWTQHMLWMCFGHGCSFLARTLSHPWWMSTTVQHFFSASMAVLFASTKSKSRCCMHFFSASTAVLYASTKSESRCYMHFFSASMAMLILHLRSLKADVAWSGGARFCLWSYRQPTVPVKVGCWVECREWTQHMFILGFVWVDMDL